MRAVPGGLAGGTGVVPEDGADDLPLVGFQAVGPVHPGGLPVLLAEATVARGSPTAAAVREAGEASYRTILRGVYAAPPRRGLDEAPRRRRGFFCFFRCAFEVPGGVRFIVAQPQQSAQVHVVVPHVEAVPGGRERALGQDLSLHRCHLLERISSQSLCARLESLVFVDVGCF